MSDVEEETWISWHCNIRGNEYLCEIETDYIEDKFNLTGLSDLIPYYKEAIQIILEENLDESIEEKVGVDTLEKSACVLYGLIHARYIMTSEGMNKMISKWKHGDFGKCPNYYCQGQLCLPIGLHPTYGNEYVKNYCPSCCNVYNPRSHGGKLDSAYIGPSFPHMLFMMYPALRPEPVANKLEAKLFGFKIHPSAHSNK